MYQLHLCLLQASNLALFSTFMVHVSLPYTITLLTHVTCKHSRHRCWIRSSTPIQHIPQIPVTKLSDNLQMHPISQIHPCFHLRHYLFHRLLSYTPCTQMYSGSTLASKPFTSDHCLWTHPLHPVYRTELFPTPFPNIHVVLVHSHFPILSTTPQFFPDTMTFVLPMLKCSTTMKKSSIQFWFYLKVFSKWDILGLWIPHLVPEIFLFLKYTNEKHMTSFETK